MGSPGRFVIGLAALLGGAASSSHAPVQGQAPASVEVRAFASSDLREWTLG